MSEPNNTPSVLGEAFLGAIRQAVREEIEASQSRNGHGGDGELLSAKKLGERWDIKASWIRSMARRGELPCVRLGHYVRFSPADLARFIQRHKK